MAEIIAQRNKMKPSSSKPTTAQPKPAVLPKPAKNTSTVAKPTVNQLPNPSHKPATKTNILSNSSMKPHIPSKSTTKVTNTAPKTTTNPNAKSRIRS